MSLEQPYSHWSWFILISIKGSTSSSARLSCPFLMRIGGTAWWWLTLSYLKGQSFHITGRSSPVYADSPEISHKAQCWVLFCSHSEVIFSISTQTLMFLHRYQHVWCTSCQGRQFNPMSWSPGRTVKSHHNTCNIGIVLDNQLPFLHHTTNMICSCSFLLYNIRMMIQVLLSMEDTWSVTCHLKIWLLHQI